MNTIESTQLTKHRQNARLTSRWLCIACCFALLAMPLLLVRGDLLAMSLLGGSKASTQTTQVTTKKSASSIWLYTKYVSSVNGFHVSFKGTVSGPPYPATATFTWTPPGGAKDFEFNSVDPQPQRLDGPPVQYVWNLNVDQTSGETTLIEMRYTPVAEYRVASDVNTVAMDSSVGNTTTSVKGADTWYAPKPAVSQQDGIGTSQTVPTSSTDAYNIWWVHNVTDVPDATMTTDLCQNWMNFLQSSATFFALRYPVYPPLLNATDSYTQPVVFRDVYSPTLRLYVSNHSLFTAPMEYRPGRFTFLETELPSAPGEHWLALGVARTPMITCPAGLNAPGGTWEFQTDFQLDFGGAEDANAGQVLALYSCYEGQNAPFFFTQPGQAAGKKPRAPAYQGQGITCAGPQPIRLVEYSTSRIEIGDPHSFIASPPQQVTLDHYISNYGSVPVTVTLSYTSTRGLPWGIYSDAAGTIPLVGPVRLEPKGASGWSRNFYLIADIAAGTSAGSETLTITATDVALPSRTSWTSDSVWVGAWVPPLGVQQYIHLPLILR